MSTEFDHVQEIARRLRRAGGRAVLAGGCVRDRLLGRKPHDFDLEVHGLSAAAVTAALAESYPLDLVGMSFGVMKVRHHDIDIALPRSENKTGRGHRGFIVETDGALDFAAAAARRDFTVNAIMMDALTGEIIDPWHGREDLENRVLRHVSEHFSEDPLRALRGMQFVARFGLTPAPETVKLCAAMDQNELPRERIAAEWEKLLLQAPEPSRGLVFLREIGYLKYYPELAALTGCPQDPRWHPEGDVWTHTLAVLDAAAGLRRGPDDDRLTLMLAALCHDFGKPHCTVREADGGITSRGHDTWTVPAENFLARFWNRESLIARTLKLIRGHMQPCQLVRAASGDRAYRHLALAAERLDLLADLVESDMRGVAASPEELTRKLALVAAFRAKAEALAIDRTPPKPLVLGRHLLARGVAPGPHMRPLLDRCFAAQLNGEFADLDGGLAYLDRLLR